MTPVRILSNIIGGMLLIQVILGGAATVLNISVFSHLVWGVITFVVLLVLVFIIVREYGAKSPIFRLSLAAVVDFILQGVLGFLSFSSNVGILVHLTNAFLLAVLVATMIGMLARTQPPNKKVVTAAPS